MARDINILRRESQAVYIEADVSDQQYVPQKCACQFKRPFLDGNNALDLPARIAETSFKFFEETTVYVLAQTRRRT